MGRAEKGKRVLHSSEFAEAIRHHQAGRLREADALYRRLLRSASADPEAMHLLGILCHQTGRPTEAAALIKRAVAMAPNDAGCFNNLAAILGDSGQAQAALFCALAAGKLDPAYAEGRNTLGNLLKTLGSWDAAEANYRLALLAKPDLAEGHFNLATLLAARGHAREALPHLRRTRALRPDLPEAHNSLGNAFRQLQMPDESAAGYRLAVLHRPSFAEAYSNLGNALHDLGRLSDAAACYRKALNLRADLAEAHSNLGTLLAIQQRRDEAAAHFRAAVCCKPDYAEAYNNFGNAQAAQGRAIAAMTNLRRGLTIQPDYPEGLNNLGNVLKDQGDLQAALDCYRQTLVHHPGFLQAHSNLLMGLSFDSGSTPQEYLDEARRYGAKVRAAARPYSHATPSPRDSSRALRVGLVSGDLRRHPVGFFLEGLLPHLDRSRFQLYAYATNSRQDELSARIRPFFAAWAMIGGLSDGSAAQCIHDDGIDILIDLAGHTANNRLALFARKPAPVQCSWLGYFASTGLAEMDYLLVDPVAAPAAVSGQFTETLWHLPDTRLCFTPPEEAPTAPGPLPALRNGFVTFGCFQNLAKFNDAVLALWGRILGVLPSARLRLQNSQANCPEAREALRQRLCSAGIAAGQIVIEGPRSRRDYLAAHDEVDIVLDTFPYPGGTTTCEALWMGVPTVTLAGTTLLARQGASLLAAAGLPDWIATDADDYCRRALSHASDPHRLAELRARLRQQVLASPLFDGRRFARNLEQALTEMWQRAANSTRILPTCNDEDMDRR